MSAPNLEAIKARLVKATPEPWERRSGDPRTENHVANVRGVDVYGPYRSVSCGDDAEFIAHARQDVPALIREVERLRVACHANGEIVAGHIRVRDALQADVIQLNAAVTERDKRIAALERKEAGVDYKRRVLLGALERLEWRAGMCYACSNTRTEGHASSCWLQEAMREGQVNSPAPEAGLRGFPVCPDCGGANVQDHTCRSVCARCQQPKPCGCHDEE